MTWHDKKHSVWRICDNSVHTQYISIIERIKIKVKARPSRKCGLELNQKIFKQIKNKN